MGKNRHDRHGGEIKGDTATHPTERATDTVLKFLSCDTSISYHATLRHKHKIWDPCIPLQRYVGPSRYAIQEFLKESHYRLPQARMGVCVARGTAWDRRTA